MFSDVERVGEVFLVGFRGLTVTRWLRDFEAEFGLGGVLLFDYDVESRSAGRNIESPEQLANLCDELHALPSRPLICIDQEGGRVRRLKPELGFAELPSAAAFSALEPAEQREVARTSYREMAALGIDLNLAPVVDLNLHPENPNIGALERSFSCDPSQVNRAARGLFDAAREVGLLLCLKHYPGLGAARTDSHQQRTELPSEPPLEQLKLFEELAAEVPGEAILMSHALLPDWDREWPVSLSETATCRLRGARPSALLISDDLQMQGLQVFANTIDSCSRAIEVGIDWLCIGNNLQGNPDECFAAAHSLRERAQRSAAFADQLRASAERVRARKEAKEA